MALGLFASCSESLVAPAADVMEQSGVSALTKEVSPEFCTQVDGLWVCGDTTPITTLDDGDGDGPHCEMILGVWHCPRDTGS